MSRPPSILITRTDPDYQSLKKRYRKEKEGDKVRRINVILLMYKMKNAEKVAELLEIEADTVRRWVEAFNEEGLEGLYKKKVPVEDPSSPPSNNLR